MIISWNAVSADYVCFVFDLYRVCKNMLLDSGNENVIYVSSGKEVKGFDVHLVIIHGVDEEITSSNCGLFYVYFFVHRH